MSRETREELREAVEEYQNELRGTADLCHAVVLLLRDVDGPDVAAALRVAETAESWAKTARDNFPLVARETIAAAGIADDPIA
jgi:hypothetical protein